MAISAGVAYVDVLPNMSKFGPAMAAESGAASQGLKGLAATGALALGAVAAASVKLAVDFEASMRNVNSIAQLPEPAFEQLQQDVLDLAGPTAQAPKTLADGLYDLVSSGFSARDSLKILEASAYAATAGLTTTDVSTKAVAAVLNAYKLPATEAARVSDQLFKTVDQGVITFEDLATNIGDTLPFAASLGVGLEEVGAATSTLTKQGLSGAETFTRIRNLLQTMIKPGTDLKNAFDELGVESGEALIKQEGLQGALEALVGTTDGSKEAVAKLFPNIRALGGALALTGENAKGAREDLKSLQDSAGATMTAFEEQQKSVAVQFQRLSANLQALGIRIGQAVLPVLNEVLQVLNEQVGPAFSKIMSVVGPVLTFISQKFGIIKTVILSAFVGPIGLAIGMILRLRGPAVAVWNAIKSAAQAAFSWLRGAAQTLVGFFNGVWNAIKSAGRVVWNVIRVTAAPLFAWLRFGFNNIRAIAVSVWNTIKGAATIAFNVIRVATAPFRAAVSAAFNAIKSVAVPIWNTIKSVATTAFNGIKSAMNTLKSVASSVFGAIGSAISALEGPIATIKGAIDGLIGVVSDAIAALGDLIRTGDAATKAFEAQFNRPAPGRAGGGPVGKGDPYLVGERGPELFVPAVSGKIVPNHRLAGIAAGGRGAFVITNWREGTGYFRDVAAGEVANDASLRRQRSRMRT